MTKRLAAVLLSSLFLTGVFLQPAWTQTTTQPAAKVAGATLPEKFDLRSVDAVTPIKRQLGGTCWTHGTMASIESHLLLSGKWKAMNMKGIPMLAEYHLDWWNGFNKKHNEDLTDPNAANTGLTVHQGGDYRVAAAYISRGDGVVVIPFDEENAYNPKKWHGGDGKDGDWKTGTPKNDPSFKRLYVRDIEWFTMGDNLEGIELIKDRIMKVGALGTCYKAGRGTAKDFVHYQAISDEGPNTDPNHSVAIIGWDDTKISSEDAKKAPKPGSWLIKNSWGDKSGDKGYYWISYYDKHCCRHPEMGAVSFRNVEPLSYNHIYYHDTHGWRDTLGQVSKAFNAFKATGRETMKAVSFYTAQHNVSYTVEVYSTFENGKLSGKLATQTGKVEYSGYHTVDLQAPVKLKENDKFYVYVELSAGGHAIDRTSNIPVLLDEGQKGGGGAKPIVISKASARESYYLDGGQWKDLYEYKFTSLPKWATDRNITFDGSANFCIKALCVNAAQ